MVSIQGTERLSIDDVIRRSPVKDNPRAKQVLTQCLARSEMSWVGQIKGDVVCVWGLCPPTLMSERAYIWLLTTDDLADHKFLFIRHSQLLLEKMLAQYPVIVGEVMAENLPARKWIGLLGATFGPPDENGVISFEIRKAR